MKLLILSLAFMTLATCFKPVHAGEVSISLTQKSLAATEDIFSANLWVGAKLSYQPDNSDWYYFISKEVMEVAPIYKAWTYDMTGIGIGTKYKLTPNISLFGQMGYYIIKNDWGPRKTQFNEGLHYYMNRRFYGSQSTFYNQEYGPGRYYSFSDYSVENDNALGATIGLELMRPISKNWKAGFIASYRIIKIKEDINAYFNNYNDWRWQHSPTRDYSSKNMGITLIHEF